MHTEFESGSASFLHSGVAAAATRASLAGRCLALACVAAATALATVPAKAACADPRLLRSTQPAITLPPPADTASLWSKPASENIVGTWLVSYASGGVAAGQAFIQWHSDGTEWENVDFPIEGGNVCLGSWRKVDVGHVSRNHYGWLYTNGVVTGYFNETETTAVAHNGTYAGTTETMVYDLDGNLQTQFAGTSSAVRITP